MTARFFLMISFVFFQVFVLQAQGDDTTIPSLPVSDKHTAVLLASTSGEPTFSDLNVVRKAFDQAMTDPENTCQEELTEIWFQKFNELQSQGYDMEQADGLALISALQAYRACMSQGQAPTIQRLNP